MHSFIVHEWGTQIFEPQVTTNAVNPQAPPQSSYLLTSWHLGAKETLHIYSPELTKMSGETERLPQALRARQPFF